MENYIESIMELENGFFIILTINSNLVIYDNYLAKKFKIEIEGIKEPILIIYEKYRNDNKYKIVVSSKNESSEVSLHLDRNYSLENNNYEKSNNYLMHIFAKFDKIKNVLIINDEILVLITNIKDKDSEDKLIMYNKRSKNIIKEFQGYHFIDTKTSLVLIIIEDAKINKNKILLFCCCNKYNNKVKNGILILNPPTNSHEEIKESFYETGDFEVYCICQLLNVNNKKNILINDNKKTIKITLFFLVGGFDKNNKKGIIKLYKLINNDEIDKDKDKEAIIFIQDIEFVNDKFEKPINCLIQSKTNGKVYFSCSDRIYSFAPPINEFYINNINT